MPIVVKKSLWPCALISLIFLFEKDILNVQHVVAIDVMVVMSFY